MGKYSKNSKEKMGARERIRWEEKINEEKEQIEKIENR